MAVEPFLGWNMQPQFVVTGTAQQGKRRIASLAESTMPSIA